MRRCLLGFALRPDIRAALQEHLGVPALRHIMQRRQLVLVLGVYTSAVLEKYPNDLHISASRCPLVPVPA
jgi:hypothetical protein